MDPTKFLTMAKSLTNGKGTDTIELPAPESSYDRLLNGINRTGRPLLLVGAVAFFIWGIVDPKYFVTVMKAYATTPEFVSTAILMIIGIFGTGRIVRDVKQKSVLKQKIADAEPVLTEEEKKKKAEDAIPERRFDNLKGDEEDLEEVVNIPPENSAIQAWKQKNAA